MQQPALTHRLSELKRRMLALGAARAAAMGLMSAIATLLLLMWLDLAIDMPPKLRLAAIAVAVAAGLIIFIWICTGALRRSLPTRLARQLDRVGRTGGQILAGTDFMLRPAAIAGAAPITHGLRELAIERAGVLAAAVPRNQVAPPMVAYAPAGALAGLLLVVGALALWAPRVAATQWSRFFDPFADHAPFSSTIFHVAPGDARVIYGSGVDIRVSTEGPPVDQLEAVVQTPSGDDVVPMFQDSSGQWGTTFSNVTDAGTYFVRAHAARSERYRIDVVTLPLLQSVRVRITPPSYTHLGPYDGMMPQGGISGLKGTRVDLWAKSNRPLSGGKLALSLQAPATQPSTMPSASTTDTRTTDTRAVVTMSPVSGATDEVHGEFQLTSAGLLQVQATDIAGQDSAPSGAIPITLLTDHRPFVRIVEPKETSFATPDVVLNVNIQAEDDYGISRLQLFRGLNESRFRPMEIPVPAAQPARLAASLPLKLSDYGLEPGDVVKLFARVEDNDPDGIKGFEGAQIVVHIISRQDMDRMQMSRDAMEVLQSKYAQAQRALESADQKLQQLSKDLAALDPKSALAQDKRDQIAKLANELAKSSAEVSEFADKNLPFDIDHAMGNALKDVAKSLANAGQAGKKLADTPALSAGAAAQGVDKIRKDLGAQREEYKKEVTDPLEKLSQIFPLMEDQQRYLDLYQHQRDLAQRMYSLSNDPADPEQRVRMRDLQAEQQAARQELGRLLDDIDQHANQLPEDPKVNDLRKTAHDFAQAVRGSAAADQMASAETALGDFSGSVAQGNAKRAADTLEKFIGHCNSMAEQGKACLKFQPGLSEKLGDSVEQLLGAEGMGTKAGNGGGGYSSRRSTLSNVGLYGGMPTRPRPNGGGGSLGGAATANDSEARSLDPRSMSPGGQDASNLAGESAGAVPPRYRQRVGDYFRRVDDELGEGQSPSSDTPPSSDAPAPSDNPPPSKEQPQ